MSDPAPTTDGTRTDGTRTSSRTALVAAAFEEFTAKGYEAATVMGIADRAGVTTGALYAHFDSKLDLLLATVGLQSIRSALEAAASATTRPAEEVAAMLGRDLARPPDRRTLLLLDVIVVARRDPEVAATLRRGLDGYLEATVAVASAARAAGMVDPALSSDDLARLMAAITFGLMVLGALDEEPPSEEAFVHVADALLQPDALAGAEGAADDGSPPALARLAARAAVAARARRDLELAVASASAAGHSLREVGRAAGLSHERVRRMLAARAARPELSRDVTGEPSESP